MDAATYIAKGSRYVKGWLAQESRLLVQAIAAEQVDNDTRGAVGEIGIFHGRHFILLYLLARNDERAFAIDLFEAQHLNVDDSGVGDRGIFEANLRRIGADFSRIDILSGSSLEVGPDDITSRVGPVRMFSVDGGHTTEITLNDLRLAEATLVDGGVVILDDVFQSLFPGVGAALAHFLPTSELIPFAVSPEKVLLTQPAHHSRLLAGVRRRMGDLSLRTEDYFGSQVAIIRAVPSRQERLQLGFAEWGGYQQLRSTPVVGQAIEKLRPAVLRMLRR